MSNTFAKITMGAVAATGAAVSVLSYGMDLWSVDALKASVYMALFAVAAPVEAVLADRLKSSSIKARAGLIAGIVVFTTISAFGLGNAVLKMRVSDYRIEYTNALAEWEQSVQADKNIVTAMTEKLATTEAPEWDAAKYVYGSRYETDLKAHEAKVTNWQAQKDQAQAKIDAAPKPVMKSDGLNVMLIVFLLAGLVQFTIPLVMACLGDSEKPATITPANDETAISDRDISNLAYTKTAKGLELLVFGKEGRVA